jgi:hypothetical protein
MSAAGAIRAGAAYVEVFLEQNALSRSLAATSAKLRGWAAGLGRLGAATRGGELPGPLAAIANFSFSPAGLVTGMLAAVREWSRGGAELAHLAEQAGTTVEAFSALSYAARRTGVDTAGLATGIRKMQVTIAAAARGMPQAGDALAYVGASLELLARMRPEEQFRYLADRIAAIPNPTERAAVSLVGTLVSGSFTVVSTVIGLVGNYAPEGKTAPNFQGAIGVTDDSVEGCEIIVPQFKWTETHQLDAAVVTWEYSQVLEDLTGKTNENAFRGFGPYRVLFHGAKGSQSAKNPDLVEMTFSFAAGRRLERHAGDGRVRAGPARKRRGLGERRHLAGVRQAGQERHRRRRGPLRGAGDRRRAVHALRQRGRVLRAPDPQGIKQIYVCLWKEDGDDHTVITVGVKDASGGPIQGLRVADVEDTAFRGGIYSGGGDTIYQWEKDLGESKPECDSFDEEQLTLVANNGPCDASNTTCVVTAVDGDDCPAVYVPCHACANCGHDSPVEMRLTLSGIKSRGSGCDCSEATCTVTAL